MNNILKIANATNGLVYPHDDVSMFLSTYGHHMKYGYFPEYAMPWKPVIHLLMGGSIEIIDATRHNYKDLSDGLKYGFTTWMLVFNRALKVYNKRVAPWQTNDMRKVANSNKHKRIVHRIRRLISIYGKCDPLEVGKNVIVTCHKGFVYDDKLEEISKLIKGVII